MTYKILDLFSGLGGFSLGLERTGYFKTIAFCDNDKFSKLILDKHWKGVKIYDNVKEISKEKFIADGIQFPDIITGGFPCQPFSVAGKQKGTSDDRHLWPEMFRIIQEFTPRWVIGENVKGLTNIQDGVVFETVCSDLEGAGYEVRAFNIPAAGVGAPHRRERIWIIASLVNANSDGSFTTTIGGSVEKTSNDDQEREIKTRESERTSGRERDENMENSRRTLQQGTKLQGENEDEVREGYANQHQRSSSSSESNVADTYARLSNGTYEEVQSRRQTFDTSSEGSTDVANTTSSRPPSESIRNIKSMGEESSREEERRNQSSIRTSTRSSESPKQKLANTDSERLEGQRQSSRQFSQKFFTSDSSEGRQGTMDQGWWSVEPNVGRVAHGVSGRVHRLKGLGNSIVPQIAEEIGRAIIKAERSK